MEERIKSMPEIPNFRQMFLKLAILVFTFFWTWNFKKFSEAKKH